MTRTLPAYITRMPAIFKYRATTPVGPAGTIMDIAGGKLAVTESDEAGQMWVWARTRADADAAVRDMPSLKFGPSA